MMNMFLGQINVAVEKLTALLLRFEIGAKNQGVDLSYRCLSCLLKSVAV